METNTCPKTWMAESILVTIFCCLPFGIAGIVFAAKVSSLYAAGKYEEAEAASKNAGKWTKSDSLPESLSSFSTRSSTEPHFSVC